MHGQSAASRRARGCGGIVAIDGGASGPQSTVAVWLGYLRVLAQVTPIGGLYTLDSGYRSDVYRPCYTPRHLSPLVTLRGRRWPTRPHARSPHPPPRRLSGASASRPCCARPWRRRWPGAARSSSSAARRGLARRHWPRACWPRRRRMARWCWSGAATTSARPRPTAPGKNSSPARPSVMGCQPCPRRCCLPGGRATRSSVRRRSSAACAPISRPSPRASRSRSSSTTYTGPTPPPSTCCALSRGVLPISRSSCSPATAPTRSPTTTR